MNSSFTHWHAMNILHLDSSIMGDASASRSLTAEVVATLRRSAPDAAYTYRDLAADPIPHLDGAIAAGFRGTDAQSLPPETRAEHARSEDLVTELLDSDVIVVGAPMYNFSVASQLKAWIDRVAQPGRTFRYTASGPIGLTVGKRVVVVSTRGGMYSEGAAAAMDFQEAYLRAVFRFLGIEDVRFLRAERLTKGAETRADSLEAAQRAVGDLVLPMLTGFA